METPVSALAEAPPYPRPRECPYQPSPEYQAIGKQGPMNKVTLWNGETAWLVTGHAHGRSLLSDPRISADRARPDFPVVLPRFEAAVFKPLAVLGFDPPQHSLQRALLTPEFSMRAVRAKRESVEQLVVSLADRMLAAGPPADLVADFALPIPSIVTAQLLGVPYDDHAFFEDATVRLLQAPTGQDAEAAGQDLYDYLDEQIRHLEREPDETLLSRLAEHVDDEELGRDLVVKIALALLVGGHDTTSQMIALGVVTLLDHPDQLAYLQANPSALPTAVEELLRMVSVTDLAGVRVATEDVEIGGQVIARGEGVILSSSMLNRDPAVFENPYEFNVHRSEDNVAAARRHLTFGYGIHQCVGRNLARMELEVSVRVLFEKIPQLRLATPRDELPMRRGSTMQGVHQLPVTW